MFALSYTLSAFRLHKVNTITSNQLFAKSSLDKLHARCRLDGLGWEKPLRRSRFFGRAYFALWKGKGIRSKNLQSYRLSNEKVTVNSKYYPEHQHTCDILKFIYLMASKLLYLVMDWETFSSFMTEVPII